MEQLRVQWSEKMKIQNLGDVLSDEFTTVALIIGFLGIIFTLVVLSTIILSGENL